MAVVTLTLSYLTYFTRSYLTVTLYGTSCDVVYAGELASAL